MQIIHTATFRSFHQGVDVTLSIRQDGANYIVRCRPCGYPLRPEWDTSFTSLTEAESFYTTKFNVGMTGVP